METGIWNNFFSNFYLTFFNFFSFFLLFFYLCPNFFIKWFFNFFLQLFSIFFNLFQLVFNFFPTFFKLCFQFLKLFLKFCLIFLRLSKVWCVGSFALLRCFQPFLVSREFCYFIFKAWNVLPCDSPIISPSFQISSVQHQHLNCQTFAPKPVTVGSDCREGDGMQ